MKKIAIKKQRGFTLPELLLGAAVISIAAIAILAGGKNILDGQKVSGFHNFHLDLIGKISQFYSPDFDYTGITTDGVRAIVRNYVSGSGGTATLKPSISGASGSIVEITGQSNLFGVAYQNLPAGQCASLVQPLAQRAVAVSVLATNGAAANPFPLNTATSVKNLIAGNELNRTLLNTTCANLTSSTFSVVFVNQ